MARYLIQDHRFLDSFLTLLGAALAPPQIRSRPGCASAASSGRCPAMRTPTSPAFEALSDNEDRRVADPDTQASTGFKAIMHQAAETSSYAAVLLGPRRDRVALFRLGFPR